MSDSDDDDDVPQLSADTLAALQEFYAETGRAGQNTAKTDKFSVGAVDEDWVLIHNTTRFTCLQTLMLKLLVFIH